MNAKPEQCEPLMITIPLAEVLEILKLSTKIEYPDCTYVPEEPLQMANNAIRLMQQSATAISEILYRWNTNYQKYYTRE